MEDLDLTSLENDTLLLPINLSKDGSIFKLIFKKRK